MYHATDKRRLFAPLVSFPPKIKTVTRRRYAVHACNAIIFYMNAATITPTASRLYNACCVKYRR